MCWLRPGPTERAGKVCCEGLGQGGRVRVRSRREVEESGHWGMEVEGEGSGGVSFQQESVVGTVAECILVTKI